MRNMVKRFAEPTFDVLISFAIALAFMNNMLGLFVDPSAAVIISLVLVIGATVLIPREKQIMAGIIGSIAVVVGGLVIPRFIVFKGVADEFVLIIALSGFVLLLSFCALRITIFRQSTTEPA
jgi:hypothetical protein